MLNDAKPFAFVVTLTVRRKLRPCAEPFGLALVSAKSSMVKVVLGVLVNLPVTRKPPRADVTDVSTGAAWLLLACGESFMPSPLLSKMEFRRVALPCPDFTHTPEGDVLIDGGASVSEVNERFGLSIPEEDFDTIGGYIFGTLGRVPVQGDTVDGLGQRGENVLEVEELEDRRVTRVRLRRTGALVTPDS